MHTDVPLSGQLVPAEEIARRVVRLQHGLEEKSLDGALILDPLNMYYYTGTIQQGLVFVPTAGEAIFLVRRSYERARLESPLLKILPLKGFSQLPVILADLGLAATALGVAEAHLSVALFRTLAKTFAQAVFTDISDSLSLIRAVKSEYEVDLIRTAGLLHQQVYDAIPAMLRPGMTEWELGSKIQQQVMALGYSGITRFVASGAELFLGVVSFGESGNYPTASVGPGGQMGLSPAFPLVGGRRRLGRGEPIFIDAGFGYEGYFTDKTRIFSLGPPPAAALAAHQLCLDIQEAARSRLKPGAVPSQIYREVQDEFVFARGFAEHFMGFGSNQVSFLGHGIGLAIDEFPAIAGKIHTPLEANMVIALEPKKGLAGIGLVGVENTYLVTAAGGEKLTPGTDHLIVV
ncbi:MAG: Xaa-Pro peptidase family protein [Proteobacteria bacterium]|nr:Xaa-Pro peptidase family protein [Pseudomonadota bacterium]